MTTPPVELAVLDIAGTTVDDGQQVYQVLDETVRAHGGAPSQADLARWHGAAKHEALRALLDSPGDAALAAIVDDFRARLVRVYAERPPRPLPGVAGAFAALRSAGVRIALNTGFDREVTDALLHAIGWHVGTTAPTTTVDAVVCGSEVPAGRPAPFMIFRAMEALRVTDVARVLVAGDTPRDLAAGVRSGAGHVVGVLSGASSAAELGAHRHTHLLPSVADLPALLGLPVRTGAAS